MLERLRIWTYSRTTWVNILRYMLYAALLLLITISLDLGFLGIKDNIPYWLKIDSSISISLLGTLAGALLAITTFTFSTIMTVIVMYSSNYSPRVIENFTKVKTTLSVLGVFIGGFFYCISAMIFLSSGLVSGGVISGVAGAAYSVLSVIYFVLFVQRVIYNMQDVNLINDIFEDTKVVISKELARRGNSVDYVSRDGNSDSAITAVEGGYLGSIDYSTISRHVDHLKGVLLIEIKIGDYVTEGTMIGKLVLREGTVDMKDIDLIEDCFKFSDEKLSIRDYRYGITKLTEISLRAVSPGINDPNTAVHSIRKTSVLLSMLAGSDKNHISLNPNKDFTIFYTANIFDQDIYEAYHQIIHYGDRDVFVMAALMEGLYIIYRKCTPNNRIKIREYADSMYDRVVVNLKDSYEKNYFRSRYFKFPGASERVFPRNGDD